MFNLQCIVLLERLLVLKPKHVLTVHEDSIKTGTDKVNVSAVLLELTLRKKVCYFTF